MRAGLLTIRALPGLPMPAGLGVILVRGRLLVSSLGLVETRVLAFRACRALPGLAGTMLLTGTPAGRPCLFVFFSFVAGVLLFVLLCDPGRPC